MSDLLQNLHQRGYEKAKNEDAAEIASLRAAVCDLADHVYHESALAKGCPGCAVEARHASTIQACRENQ